MGASGSALAVGVGAGLPGSCVSGRSGFVNLPRAGLHEAL